MNNKPFYLLMIAAASVLLLGSCKEDEKKPEIGSIEVSSKHDDPLPANSGSFTVDVTSSHEFSVNTPNWITIESEEDTFESGTLTLTFNYTENTNTTARTGNIIFRCLDTRDTLVVNQAAGEDLYHDEFMKETEPGLYGQNFDSFTYQEFASQYSIRNYANGQSFDYKIISLNPNQFVTVKSIPTELEEGTTHSLGVQQNITDVITPNYFYTITIEKIEGNKIWLYEPFYRFGIIVTKE